MTSLADCQLTLSSNVVLSSRALQFGDVAIVGIIVIQFEPNVLCFILSYLLLSFALRQVRLLSICTNAVEDQIKILATYDFLY